MASCCHVTLILDAVCSWRSVPGSQLLLVVVSPPLRRARCLWWRRRCQVSDAELIMLSPPYVDLLV